MGHIEILKAIIEHGADVDAVNIQQATALHLASLENNAEAINVLATSGANIEAWNRGGLVHPLFFSIARLPLFLTTQTIRPLRCNVACPT